MKNPFQQEIESGASASKAVGLLIEAERNDLSDEKQTGLRAMRQYGLVI